MSTRSQIGLLHADGNITSVYCHSDGYWSWNGRVLWEHWRDGKGIKKMMSLGAMSTLGEVIGTKHDFDWSWNTERDYGAEFHAMSSPEKEKYLDSDGKPNRYVFERAEFDKDPRSKMCRFYRRDRGEKDVDAYHGPIKGAPWEEFAYLYDEANKRWITSDTYVTPFKWHLLSDVMAFYEQMPADEDGHKHLGHGGLPDDFPTIELPEPILPPEDQAATDAAKELALF